MPEKKWSAPSNDRLPLILIRGFGGLDVEDEKRIAYQGFNDGTVYPQKRGENYIYEGLILRLMKSNWKYQDATNVVGYYANPVKSDPQFKLPPELKTLDQNFFINDKVIIDPAMALHLIKNVDDPSKTIWIFRYYDLNDRKFEVYGKALVRLIDFIRALSEIQGRTKKKVNIIAHSMGGLLVREAIQRTYPKEGREADEHINKIVTLGTPHGGIVFQLLKEWIKIDAEQEIEHFSPDFQKDKKEKSSYVNFYKYFPLERLLTVVGTNYRSYNVQAASWLNRVFSMSGEYGLNYNRSDGLVKQTAAQIPGAPRTFVHKCHGGFDSLVTARESFEIATRFFYGNKYVRLRMIEAEVTRGKDWIGKSEFFFGVSIKPRGVDFDLFHQSAEAENCYGPFNKTDFTDKEVSFSWAGENRLIWEGYLDTSMILSDSNIPKNLVMRLDFYVGERDLYGVGFSDNVIFRKQYYVRAILEGDKSGLYLHPDEAFIHPGYNVSHNKMSEKEGGWDFLVEGTGFKGIFRIEINDVP